MGKILEQLLAELKEIDCNACTHRTDDACCNCIASLEYNYKPTEPQIERRTFSFNCANFTGEGTIYTYTAEFIKIGDNKWLCARNIETQVSYKALAENGYVVGTEETVHLYDGDKKIPCSAILRVPTFSEWDDAIDISDADDVWHWEHSSSWVRLAELERSYDTYGFSRGNRTARYWIDNTATNAYANLGFRPCLELRETK